ncbi:MAG: radical SAM protein [Anaerolineales bacterium]|jgi:wyosine [tRNA(Phe)-imidazoG37] synthetase (radical SAM superfamily)
MKYVFGPVPSRRLGRSLGIDPIPLKTCNWNCVYCQLGRTRPLTNKIQPYHPIETILAEVSRVLAADPPPAIDWITIVGSGEPTLHAELGQLIIGLQGMTSLPIAVITNGALLFRPETRAALKPAQAVLPSLDAGSAELYKRINRPYPELSFERVLEGLVQFRREYSGHYWLEVMLMDGLNDSENALQDLAGAIARIQPDLVHLSLPTRPPAEDWVKPSTPQGQARAISILGEHALVISDPGGDFKLDPQEDILKAIASILQRHPMSQDQLEQTIAQQPEVDVEDVLHRLESSGLAQVVIRQGQRFWSSSESYYAPKDN